MNTADLRAMKDDLDVAALNYSETLNRIAANLIDNGDRAYAGDLLVADRVSRGQLARVQHWLSSLVQEDEKEPGPARRAPGRKRAPTGAGEHRHKYNDRGVCGLLINGALCGAVRQRKARGAEPEPASAVLPRVGLPAGYRAPVPAPVDDDGEDVYSRGTMGGSSTTERAR